MVWLVETNKGRFVVKEFINRDFEFVQGNQKLQNIVNGKNIHTPSFVHNHLGKTLTKIKGRIFEITEYIPHALIHDTPAKDYHRFLRCAGVTLAFLHKTLINDVTLSAKRDPIINRIPEAKSLVQTFLANYELLRERTPTSQILKLQSLRKLINQTRIDRIKLADAQAALEFTEFDIVPTHGDFSSSNLLWDTVKDVLYVADWENFAFRPRAWEVQKTVSMLCGKGYCHPYLDAIDYNKASIFLRSYHSINFLTDRHIVDMLQVAKFNSSIAWLNFMLTKIMLGDYRVLRLIPNDEDAALYWRQNHEIYSNWLNDIVMQESI